MKNKNFISSSGLVLISLACASLFSQKPDKQNGFIEFNLPAGFALMQGFREDFTTPDSEIFHHNTGGKRADFTWAMGVESAYEPGTKVLRLKLDPHDEASPWQGPNMSTPVNLPCHFGRYSARLKVPQVRDSQPNVGAVASFFTYLNDQYQDILPKDINRNGLNDNSEIDFEWLIADPRIIFLTAHTDAHYEEGENHGKTLKIVRIINLATGHIYRTNYAERLGCDGIELVGDEAYPKTVEPISGYDASERFYTYGFDWHPDSIRWWIIHPESGEEFTLWHYQGDRRRITQKPAKLMINLWHTNDWPVMTNPNSREQPKHRFDMEVDLVSYEPLNSLGSDKMLK